MNVRRTIMSVTKEFKELREDTKKQFNGIKEKVLKENKHLSGCPGKYKQMAGGSD